MERAAPGRVRDTIVSALSEAGGPLSLIEIELAVIRTLGPIPSSSIRSYLNNNADTVFERTARGFYKLKHTTDLECGLERPGFETFSYKGAKLFLADCLDWLKHQPENSIHAVVTDPPYGFVEFDEDQLKKRASGSGGVWRVPPSFDGSRRSPLPRFTVLRAAEIKRLTEFFVEFGRAAKPALTPGANLLVASNPLLFHNVIQALASAGFESRGVLVRLVMTMRGGDRPKNAHEEFSGISVMPRSMWEPWIVMRKPIQGRVQDNLRTWGTGGFKRVSDSQPFGDVIHSRPTSTAERKVANHPSLKPQDFLRKIVQGVLPLERGVIADPFAGSGSTLAAAIACGYECVGVEKSVDYFRLAKKSIPTLAEL